MRVVSLRSFRTLGAKALGTVPEGETVVLAGQNGPAYFLVPVIGDVEAESRELRRAIAKSHLRQNWMKAVSAGVVLSDAEIDAEVTEVRSKRMRQVAQ